MAAANLATSLFGMALFIYLARVLLPESFGYLSYAFTIVFFMSNFIDMGLSTYGIREISKDRLRVSDYVSEIASFRTLVAVILWLILTVITVFLPYSNTLKLVILESSIMFFSLALATEWAFQGIEKMHMVFVSFATTSLLQLGLIFLFVKGPEDVLRAPALYFVATIPVITIFLRRLHFSFRINIGHLKRMMSRLSSSLVIWSIALLAQIYNNFDIFILGLFRPMGEVGHFSVARRVVGSVALFAVFMANALLPRLSLSICIDVKQFQAATKKFVGMAILLTTLGLLPLAIFSKRLILLTVGPEYVSAGPPLSIMTVGLVLILFNIPYSTGLIAGGFERQILAQAFASAVLSLFLNFILIPEYGMIGAAISFVLAEALGLVWILWVYRHRILPICNGNERRVS